MTGRAMGKHFNKLYSNGIKKFLIFDDIKQIRRNFDQDPIFKDSMANIGTLMVSTFGKWLSLILIVYHTSYHTKGFGTAEITKQEELEEEYG